MKLEANFNTLTEMEEFLKEKLNMCDYKILYDGEQPMYMVVEITGYKFRKVKLQERPTGHCVFRFRIRTKEEKKSVILSVHRVEYLVKNPTANIEKLVIDHIDNNPRNNAIENLQAITQRQNTTKDKKFTPAPTKRGVAYCLAKYRDVEKEYSLYLETHPDLSHNSKNNPEIARRVGKVQYWKARLAYAAQTGQE